MAKSIPFALLFAVLFSMTAHATLIKGSISGVTGSEVTAYLPYEPFKIDFLYDSRSIISKDILGTDSSNGFIADYHINNSFAVLSIAGKTLRASGATSYFFIDYMAGASSPELNFMGYGSHYYFDDILPNGHRLVIDAGFYFELKGNQQSLVPDDPLAISLSGNASGGIFANYSHFDSMGRLIDQLQGSAETNGYLIMRPVPEPSLTAPLLLITMLFLYCDRSGKRKLNNQHKIQG